MINYIILEDEPAALRRLKRLIKEIRKDWKFIASADSINTGIEVCQRNNYDLILSDIELSDGNSFEIFTKIKVKKPIIFITAYDQFAIKAFEFNSIHYLLKPIKIEQLHIAFQKFESKQITSEAIDAGILNVNKQEMAKKLLSKVGNKTSLIDYQDIAYIYFTDRSARAYLFSNKEYLLDYSMDKLMEYLPENIFYRISRQAIVNKNCILKFNTHSSNRLLLITEPDSTLKLIVSKEKTPLFKKWIIKE